MRLSVFFILLLGVTLLVPPLITAGALFVQASGLVPATIEMAVGGLLAFADQAHRLVGGAVEGAVADTTVQALGAAATQSLDLTAEGLAYHRAAVVNFTAQARPLSAAVGGAAAGPARRFAAALRSELADGLRRGLVAEVEARARATEWLVELHRAGLLALPDPVVFVEAPAPGMFSPADCRVGALLWSLAASFAPGGVGLFLSTSLGRVYHASPEHGLVLSALLNTSATPGPAAAARPVYLGWAHYDQSLPAAQRKPWLERCLTEAPAVVSGLPTCDDRRRCADGCRFDVQCLGRQGEGRAAGPYVDYAGADPVLTVVSPVYRSADVGPGSSAESQVSAARPDPASRARGSDCLARWAGEGRRSRKSCCTHRPRSTDCPLPRVLWNRP